jgi:hypothetical protein
MIYNYYETYVIRVPVLSQSAYNIDLEVRKVSLPDVLSISLSGPQTWDRCGYVDPH